jgi:hypothetical protein
MKADESVCKLSQLRPLTFLLEVSGGTVPQTSTFKYVSYGAKRLQYYRKKKNTGRRMVLCTLTTSCRFVYILAYQKSPVKDT